MKIGSMNLKSPKRFVYSLLCQLSINSLSAPNPPFFACSVLTEMSSAKIPPLPASVKLSLVSRGRSRVPLRVSPGSVGSLSQQWPAASPHTSSGSFSGMPLVRHFLLNDHPVNDLLDTLCKRFQGPVPP